MTDKPPEAKRSEAKPSATKQSAATRLAARQQATPCPVCGKPASSVTPPFCSARCAEVDLGRWLTGHYRIPGPSAELDEDPPPGPDAA